MKVPYLATTSFSSLCTAASNVASVSIFVVGGNDNDMPVPGFNNHGGIIFLNAGGTYGYCICKTFDDKLYLRYKSGSNWSSWKTLS